MKKWQKVTGDFNKKYGILIIMYFVISGINISIFSLYRIVIEPFIYGMILSGVICIVICILGFTKIYKKSSEIERIKNGIDSEWRALPEADTYEGNEYREMIRTLGRRVDELNISFDKEWNDVQDYFTIWVHQIKTPIAVMKLQLGADDTDESRELLTELFRIEQYVDMVLDYIRLSGKTNDLVIREYDAEEIVRDVVRKFAPLFIGKKLGLDFEVLSEKIVTDRKWFECIIEQLISNAIKYTNSGRISIVFTEDKKLVISDTGIGIAPEDLPRIFEKGYTGNNGRTGRKSSGLGLYLCKMAADKLNIQIKVKSHPGEGSSFILDLYKAKTLLN